MSIGGVNGAMGVDRVMALRAQILERNQALKAAAQTGGAQAAEGAAAAASAPFMKLRRVKAPLTSLFSFI